MEVSQKTIIFSKLLMSLVVDPRSY